MATREEIAKVRSRILKRRSEVALINTRIKKRNEEINKLRRKLVSPDNKRVEGLEDLIAQAAVKLTDVAGINKKWIQDPNVNVFARARGAAELLEDLIKKPWDEKEEQLPELDEDKKAEETQRLAPSGQTQGPGQAYTGETQRLAPPGQPQGSSHQANTGETQRLSRPTELLSETREDVVEDPQKAATGPTQRLDDKRTIALDDTDVIKGTPTRALPETDQQPATGQTIVQEQTGKTIQAGAQPSPEPPMNQVVFNPAPYVAARATSEVQVPLKVALNPNDNPTVKHRLETIESRTKSEIEKIKKEAYGRRLANKAAANEARLTSDVRSKIEAEEFGNLLTEFPQIAEHYQGFGPIAAARARQIQFENHLNRQGLLDQKNPVESDDRFRSMVDFGYKTRQHDRIMAQFDVDHLPSFREYNQAGTSVRRQLIQDFVEKYNLPNPYSGSITSRLSAITQRLGLGQKAAGTAATEATKKLATQGAKQVATGVAAKTAAGLTARTGLKLLIARGIQGLSTALAGPIGTLLSTLGIALMKFLKRHGKSLTELGTSVLGLGLLMGSTAIGALGAGLIGLSLVGGGPGLMLAGLTGTLATLGSFILFFILPSILIPLFCVTSATIPGDGCSGSCCLGSCCARISEGFVVTSLCSSGDATT